MSLADKHHWLALAVFTAFSAYFRGDSRPMAEFLSLFE